MGEVEDAFKKLNKEEFKKKYGGEKPDSDAHVVFSCQKGRRSQAALEIARAAGFKKFDAFNFFIIGNLCVNNFSSRHYIGGWAEWEEKTK